VTELTKRTVLKIAVGGVFICSFILALIYPAISASHKDKIHFLFAPNPLAIFAPPVGKEVDVMFVWFAVVIDSSYGSFNMAIIGYEKYYTDHQHYEYHWYTTNKRAGETYAHLTSEIFEIIGAIEYVYDVTPSKIDVVSSEHQLNATISARGKTEFTIGYWADTNPAIEPRLGVPKEIPEELSLDAEAYRPLLKALVTGIEVGEFQGGRFDYIDTELYASSLLP